MTLIDFVECPPSARERSRWVVAALAFAFTTIMVLATMRFANWPAGFGKGPITDFHDFYVVAKLIGQGKLAIAYHFPDLEIAQRAVFGSRGFLPWTYPPAFDLVIAPLGFLPVGLAYVVFAGSSFAAFALALRRLAPQTHLATLMLFLPTLSITLTCGQNGCLTAALLAASAALLLAERPSAGAVLGLMAIKPHLALGLGLYVLIARRWRTAAYALAVVAAFSGLAFLAFGAGVWSAFVAAIDDARGYLAAGRYPLGFMVSAYALVRSLGFSAVVSSGVQVLALAGAVGLIIGSAQRFGRRQAIGVALLVSPLMSPYAYNYDMPVFAIGLAMVLPDIWRVAAPAERRLFYVVLIWMQTLAYISAVVGNYFDSWIGDGRFDARYCSPSIGVLVIVGTVVFVWRMLERARAGAGSVEADSVPRLDSAYSHMRP